MEEGKNKPILNKLEEVLNLLKTDTKEKLGRLSGGVLDSFEKSIDEILKEISPVQDSENTEDPVGEPEIIEKETSGETSETEHSINKKDASQVPLEITNEASHSEKPPQENEGSEAESSHDDLPPTMDNFAENADKMKKQPISPPPPKRIIAKNGMKGKDYFLRVYDDLDLKEHTVIDEIEGLEEYGLSFNAEDGEITGQPTEDGELTFKIKYSFGDDVRILEDKELVILVNPDPRSLWKTLEPAEGEIYRKPHFHFEQKEYAGAVVYGASQRGRSHAHQGTFRDDDFTITKLWDSFLLLAVADGAGSAKYSRRGSQLACEALKDTLEKWLGQYRENIQTTISDFIINKEDREPRQALSNLAYDMVGEMVKAAREAIIGEADSKGEQAKNYATTLLFSVLAKVEEKYIIISYAIGDGVIAQVGEKVKLLSEPDGGQFAGQTRFLTMSDSLSTLNERIKISFTENPSGLYLMTDGISDPFFETDDNFSKMEKWEQLKTSIGEAIDFQAPESEKERQFEEWMGFWSPGNHDDRTLVFIK